MAHRLHFTVARMLHLKTDYTPTTSSSLQSTSTSTPTSDRMNSAFLAFENEFAQYTSEMPRTTANSSNQSAGTTTTPSFGIENYPTHAIVSLGEGEYEEAGTPETGGFSGPSQDLGASNSSQMPTTEGIPSLQQLIAETAAKASASSSAASSTSSTVSYSTASAPVVGTEGLVFNPMFNTFGGLGAAPVTSKDMWLDPANGKPVSADLIIAGYQKVYGNDPSYMAGAVLGRWGQTAYDDLIKKDPSLASNNVSPFTSTNPTLFEQYGPYSSFPDPKTGAMSYFDANGVMYADGQGPGMDMYTALGTPNTSMWNNPQAV